jgi:hypothetical protein
MLRLASRWHLMRVSLTSSVTDSLVIGTPTRVTPKISSPGAGGRTSRLMLTVLWMIYVLPVSRLVPVRMHFVVVLPISTEATMK